MNEPQLAAARVRRWRRWLGEAALFVLVVAAVGFWQTRAVPSGLAPSFSGPTANGGIQSLDDFRRAHPGRPIALHFWAEWCPICKTVEGSVDSVGQDHPVLTIAMQSGEAALVAKHLASRGLNWPTVVDNDGEIAARYGLKGVPAFIVIDPAGRIRFAEAGYTSEIGMRIRLWWAARS